MIAMRVHNASHSSMLLREKKGTGSKKHFQKDIYISATGLLSFHLVFGPFQTLDTVIYQIKILELLDWYG